MRLFLYCSYIPAAEIVPVAVEAEQLGFDGISFGEHIVFPLGHESQYLYTADGATPWDEKTDWPDPIVVAGAVAASTERLLLMTGIVVLPLRHPLLTAKAVGTIEALAPGRLSLGIGVGWLREEFEALQVPWKQRGRRTDEAIEVLRAVASGEPAAHDGELYPFDALTVRPAPGAPVPIYVGGSSEAALRRAGRLGDGFLPPVGSDEETRAMIERVRRHRAEAGREELPFDVVASAVASRGAEELAGLGELGVTAVRVDPFALYVRRYGGLTLEQRREAMAQYAADVIAPLRQLTG